MKMKKWKLALLISSLMLSILVGGFIYNHYTTISSIVSASNSQRAATETPTPTINPLEALLALDDAGDSEENTGEKNKDVNVKGPITPRENKVVDSLESQKPSFQSIVKNFNGKFKNLKDKHEEALYTVIKAGKADYSNNKGKLPALISIANNYLNKISKLEKQSDEEFNSLIKEFEEELRLYSYDTAIIKEVANYYTIYKKELKSELYSKAAQYM